MATIAAVVAPDSDPRTGSRSDPGVGPSGTTSVIVECPAAVDGHGNSQYDLEHADHSRAALASFDDEPAYEQGRGRRC